MAALGGFGVRQLAAAFLQASLLAGRRPEAGMTASKLAADKAAASCRTPKEEPGARRTQVRAQQICASVERRDTIACLNSHREKGDLPRGPVVFPSAARGQEEKRV